MSIFFLIVVIAAGIYLFKEEYKNTKIEEVLGEKVGRNHAIAASAAALLGFFVIGIAATPLAVIAAVLVYNVFFKPNYNSEIVMNESDLQELVSLANNGDRFAQYRMGVNSLYNVYFGNGTKEDEAMAIDFLVKSAQSGHPSAQFLVSCLCHAGRGIQKDMVVGEAWLVEAANNKEPYAIYTRAVDMILKGNISEGNNLLQGIVHVGLINDEVLKEVQYVLHELNSNPQKLIRELQNKEVFFNWFNLENIVLLLAGKPIQYQRHESVPVESTKLTETQITSQINAAEINNDLNFPGIYYAGTLLGRGEIPIKFMDALYLKYGGIRIFKKEEYAYGKFLLTKEHIYFTAPPFTNKLCILLKVITFGTIKHNEEKMDICIPLTDVIEAKINFFNQFYILTNERFYYFTITGARDLVSAITLAALNAKNRVNNVPSSNVESNPTDLSYTTELIRLKELMDAGIITEEEFIIKKRKLLGI